MSDDSLVEIYSRLGKKKYLGRSGWWIGIQYGILSAVPYGKIIDPSDDEIKYLLSQPGVFGLKYSTLPGSLGFTSGIFIASKPYALGSLSSKARNQYRKSLKFCYFREISFSELAQNGHKLFLSTLSRQRRSDPRAKKNKWIEFCSAFDGISSAKAFGVFCDDVLAAYSIVVISEGIAEILFQASDADYLHYCPNNLLTFAVTDFYLNGCGCVENVSYGLKSIEDTDTLDYFKISMGYKLLATKQVVVLRRFIKFFISLRLDWPLKFIIDLFGFRNYYLVKLYHLLNRIRIQANQ